MLTKEQAVNHQGEFWHMTLKNADGSPYRCRRTGATKTWKRWPDNFRIPVKFGLNRSFYITQDNAKVWCTDTNWEVEHMLFEGL